MTRRAETARSDCVALLSRALSVSLFSSLSLSQYFFFFFLQGMHSF